MKEMKKEPIDNPRIELTEKIHEQLQVSLELERKLLKKELMILKVYLNIYESVVTLSILGLP